MRKKYQIKESFVKYFQATWLSSGCFKLNSWMLLNFNKDLRKLGANWQDIDIEADDKLLEYASSRDIFSLPNPGKIVTYSYLYLLKINQTIGKLC